MPDTASLDSIERTRRAPSLDALYDEVKRFNMKPGWIRRERPILWREPKSIYVATHWRYEEGKAALDAAGRLIDMTLAERRNLVMENPAANSGFGTTRTLVCAYQMILPGEKAPAHRHAPHALRVIIDAKGAFSNVDGDKTPMETGDVVLTPGWCWHSHGHDGDAPAYWFDGLDVPLTQLLEPMFYEEHPDGAAYERDAKLVGSSPYRFTRDEMQQSLDRAKPDPEGVHGARIELAAPTMPTMGLAVERLASSAKTCRHRSTANHCFCIMEGGGASVVDGKTIDWRRGDVFVAPCWAWHEHAATSDAVLFAMSDEPLMRFVKYFRAETA
jgi:gentisate 1,2-dioxygenase